jgi:hypothetical protein
MTLRYDFTLFWRMTASQKKSKESELEVDVELDEIAQERDELCQETEYDSRYQLMASRGQVLVGGRDQLREARARRWQAR